MKATIQLLVLLVVISLEFTQCTKGSPEEIVHLPDQIFRTALIEQGVDDNRDGIITFKEAEEILTIDLWGIGVSDLCGIEAFINLDTLRTYMNPLGTIDISENKSLGC